MKYKRSILDGVKFMAKVKVFVHASKADADVNARAMTLAPWTFILAH